LDSLLKEEKDGSRICEVMQIVGAKWGFAVIAALYQGPKRFKQLQRDIAIVNPQSLTNTLRLLEQNGMVRREVFPTVPVSVEYSLTEKGKDFHSVIEEMNKWAMKWGKQQRVVENKGSM
jgi:DNA-binding HxlR family transcriptional regulator